MIENIKYYLLYSVAYLFSLLPMRVLYWVSDFAYLIVYHLVGYRKKVVRQNLRNSFPQKTDEERLKIEKDFFHWFCDYIFETIKMTSMSEEQMKRRMRFENLDEIQRAANSGKQVSVYLGHYCNWEWITSFPLSLDNCILGQIYHPLESPAADRFFLKIRGRFGAHSMKLEDTLPTIRGWMKEGKSNVVGFISDQAPGYSSMHYWPIFLNQKTATYSGAERIARLFDGAAYYMDIKRPKRGYYVSTLVKICDSAKSEPIFSLTEKYYRLLEQSIIDNPPYWLWSHKRWKRGWDKFCKHYPDEKERQRIMSKL